jgi:hypothetical protein
MLTARYIIHYYTEITGFEFKLTANKNYRSTGVVTVGDRLGGGGESRQGMNGHVFFRDTFGLDRGVLQKYRVFSYVLTVRF